MKFTYWPITQLGNYERGLWLGSNWIKLYFCCFGKNGPCLQMFTIWPIKLLRKHSDWGRSFYNSIAVVLVKKTC